MKLKLLQFMREVSKIPEDNIFYFFKNLDSSLH